ncbi:Sec20 protein (macronuclear) [Tetrahymena thermophila SB210]|uniref:Sec20 protein n=1 Tax=Tetrahymena thermophila (strain SB210) TaxID=312017 RepID=W7XG37_TETTS|nr:Sec20 protein [Tetrahymena thermophila SB210]EWS75868.1 Sec20 protein [Tetrahymena thermophila SB210]|eukprot:XP_012651603.1 Sec20 protein [Tetrahymena thermophila SB210]
MSKVKDKNEKLKQDLFAGAKQKEENFSIQSLKSSNSHIRESAALMDKYVDSFSLISQGINSGTKQLEGIDNVYQANQHKLLQGQFLQKELHKRNQKNKLMVQGSFFFLIFVVIFIFLRRLFFRDLYKWQWFNSATTTFDTLPSNAEFILSGQNQHTQFTISDGSL